MIVTPALIEEWKIYYLKTHTYPSTETYYSFIKKYVGDGIDINQKSVNKFRDNNLSPPASASLKCFFNYLVTRKEFPDEILNIRFDKSKKSNIFPKSLPIIEVQSLIDNMPTVLFKIMTAVIFECGLRVSEAVRIKWEDLNFSEWILDKNSWGKLNIKHTKRDKFRQVPITPNIMTLLYNNHAKRTLQGIPVGNLVFPLGNETSDSDFTIMSYLNNKTKTYDKNMYDYMVYAGNLYRKTLYKVSEKVLNKHISPHQLRHSKAQILLDRGLPLDSLKEFLGHETYTSTQVYAKASSQKVKMDMQRIYRNPV